LRLQQRDGMRRVQVFVRWRIVPAAERLWTRTTSCTGSLLQAVQSLWEWLRRMLDLRPALGPKSGAQAAAAAQAAADVLIAPLV